ncbi:MAG: hypothetical protein H6831_07450 [Planctomycetes bacterium]|nr:hypothetical protein [Planctomycetota bacterium]
MTPLLVWLLALAPAAPHAESVTPAPSSPLAARPDWNLSLVVATQASYVPTPFEYTYVDVLYQSIDRDGGLPKQDGLGVRGSFDVTDNIRLLASFGKSSANTPAGKDELREYSLGFGMHGSYNEWLDVIGNFEWVRREFRGISQGRHKGWLAGVGVRMLPAPKLEIDVLALFLNSVEDDAGAQLGAVWNFTPYVGARVAGTVLGDETRYQGGLRFSL